MRCIKDISIVVLLLFSLLTISCSRSPLSQPLAGHAFYATLTDVGYAEPTHFTISSDSLTQGEVLTLSVKEDYIYKSYSVWINGMWQKQLFTEAATTNSEWIASSASASLSTAQLSAGDNYIIVYSCTKTTTGLNCHDNKWQIHQFTIVPSPETPQVFNTKFYQSPVRADADNLLNILGYGFQKEAIVVYQQVSDNQVNPPPPANIPVGNTAEEGKLYVANTNLDTLTVLFPNTIVPQKTYALWVKNKNSSWSEPVLINDPRPLWVTPDTAYATKSFASLPREIKVVGRNLESTSAKLRLSGPANYDLTVANDGNLTTFIEQYAAKAALPAVMQAGTYTIQFSRDGTTWIDLPTDAKLTVLADPLPKQSFDISKNGCSPNDNADDTPCILQAITVAANTAGGGEVFFPSGQWDLKTLGAADPWYGIIVPPGVDIVGAGVDKTKIVQNSSWKPNNGNPSQANIHSIFTLQGNNQVREIHFVGEFITSCFCSNPESDDVPPDGDNTYISLGKVPQDTAAEGNKIIENVVIANNQFDGRFTTINNWGYPLRHVFLVHNIFHGYRDALSLNGQMDTYKNFRLSIQDSVILNNTFYPGTYLNTAGFQGTIASELNGGSRHLDFSNNFADGRVNNDFRAAFFFATGNNNEMMLISNNKVFCTDRVGDGEAIVFDDNGNRRGFKDLQKVLSATSNSVSVPGPWDQGYFHKLVPGWYDQHWVQIVDGKGLGQERRITSYTLDATPVTITVSPPWDVVPDSTSVITVARTAWQAYVVDNIVDETKEIGCKNANVNGITYWGQIGIVSMSSDSAIAGNQMKSTGGITASGSSQYNAHEYYVVKDTNGKTVVDKDGHPLMEENKSTLFYNGWSAFSMDVHNNVIDGHQVIHNGGGGIRMWYAAMPPKDYPFPSTVQVHNVRVFDNTIVNDKNVGIESRNGFYDPDPKLTPYQVKNLLIFGNKLQNITPAGINLAYGYGPFIWDTVLYKNTFIGISKDKEVLDFGKNTVIVS